MFNSTHNALKIALENAMKEHKGKDDKKSMKKKKEAPKHMDVKEDKALIKKSVKKDCLK